MVKSVGKVGVGKASARAGSRITIGDIGRAMGDPGWAKRVAHRSNRLASAIIGRSVSSIPRRRNSINKLLALSFWYHISFSNSLAVR